MATIRNPNELRFRQSFQIDPEKQEWENGSMVEENKHDISNVGWKNDSILFKRFLVYMNENAIYLTILQENDIILNESIFFDLDHLEPPKQFHFELFSENGNVNKKASKISSFYVSHTQYFFRVTF